MEKWQNWWSFPCHQWHQLEVHMQAELAGVALTWLWEAQSGSASTCLWKKTTPLAFTGESAPPQVTVLGIKQQITLFFSLSSAGPSGEASSYAPKSLLPGKEPRVCSCPWCGCLTSSLTALLHTAVSCGFGTKKKFTSDWGYFCAAPFFFCFVFVWQPWQPLLIIMENIGLVVITIWVWMGAEVGIDCTGLSLTRYNFLLNFRVN